MSRLRLLHIVANRWWTGSAEPALDLARALRDRGHCVRFGCIRGGALEAQARALGMTPVTGPSFERTARPWLLVHDVRALRRLVRETDADVVHAHQSHDHWLAALALRGTPVRLARTVHHRRAVHRGRALGWLWRRTHAVIASSTGIAHALAAAGLVAPPVTVVGGAVDARRFAGADPASIQAELGLDAVGPIVGCVARLVPGRGHDVLFHAIRRLRARWPRLRLLLVGRGEGRPALERLVRDLGLADAVTFAGYRSHDLPEVLAAMDCFVLVGLGSEETGRAALEAMAAGRPVVAGRCGAMPETVVPGETGWLVEARPDDVADRLADVLGDPVRARAMGEAGRRRATELFTPDRRAAAVEAIYASIVPADVPRRERAGGAGDEGRAPGVG